MYRVYCIRRTDKENADSFMLRSLLLWTKMLSFSRERGGKCGRLSDAGGLAIALGHPVYKKSLRAKNDAGLEGFPYTHSCRLRCKILHFDAIDLNL